MSDQEPGTIITVKNPDVQIVGGFGYFRGHKTESPEP
jgi:hypothetical protein